ncbi:Protein FATTY ACID EXPORT 2 chloroplastic [Zea mays]|uniref:Protein FATTY ACID EXPORT 2 chloroplastic n=1 Tax=Zea mays TaxID=4577 RepID=A0A1D6JG59_MAIZE|nr:Protein FATTY ACID EXPORT 2 chloroplastic [Zea mays]
MGHELSMSQKLSLAYAALVGAGGVMGYMKSGSQKSSALVLYFVHTQLPVRPVFASSIGLGISGRASVGDGVALQEVREDVPSWCRVPCIPGHVLLAFGVFKGLLLFYSSVDDLLTVPTENMVRHSITSEQRSINVTKSTGVAVRYAVLRNPLQNTT